MHLERLMDHGEAQDGTSRNSWFRRAVDENCALLSYYAASSGNLFPDVSGRRDRLVVPKRRYEIATIRCIRTQKTSVLIAKLMKHRNNAFFPWLDSPNGPRSPYCRGLTITPTHLPIGRTPLDEWSALPRDFYVTTHNNRKRNPCLWRVSNPQSQQTSGRRPTP